MIGKRHLGIGAMASALVLGASPLRAQNEVVQQHNPDADALATQMRVLAENPRDVDALLAAARLSTRLGDLSGSLALLQRAEAVEATNPRIASARAAVLVRMERPGEALRLFQQAESRGVDPREFAADRGFAYDLIGQPLLAQRDYKLALATRREDEVVRRYALSLGISGNRAEAERELDVLLRAQDRPAWRARAFVLAMNGDVQGAEKIAATMMPGAMGKNLLPFFRRLQALSAADRAFAVHFGELSPTPARLADARLAPSLPAYVPGASAVQVARAQTVPVPATTSAAPATRTPRSIPSRATQAQVAPPARALPTLPTPTTAPTSTPAPAPVRVRPPTPPQTARVGAESSTLASIIAGISVPESERELVSRPVTVVLPTATARTTPSGVSAAAKPKPAPRLSASAEEDASESKSGRGVERSNSRPAKAETADAKPAKGDTRKGKKPDPKKPEPKKADPARIWVQVASGANEDMLNRAWKGVVAKAPALFKGRGGWWTPVRATNRIMTGPFKTNAEAQGFVNKLAGEGVSAFVVESEAGQKVSKIAP